MNATAWIRETLATMIAADDMIVLDDTQQVSVADFATIFGASIEGALAVDPIGDMYAALSGSQTFVWEGETLTMVASEMGYQGYLDQWHAEGLI